MQCLDNELHGNLLLIFSLSLGHLQVGATSRGGTNACPWHSGSEFRAMDHGVLQICHKPQAEMQTQPRAKKLSMIS